MKYIRYVLKTKKYYFSCSILSMLIIMILLLFSKYWKRTTETLKTFEQCSSNVIAYDSSADTRDCFANFERKVRASLIKEEGESLNVFIYQFMENVVYTDKTIVNPQNVLFGNFEVLDKNEIAIPYSISEKYSLEIGDNIFIGDKSCTIKYIFRDVFQVYEVNYSMSQTIVLVGVNTIVNSNIVNYCNFNPEETVHQQLYNLNSIRNSLYKQKTAFIICISFLSILCVLTFSMFRRKEEIRAFRNYRFSGGNGTLFKLLLVEMIFIIPSILISCCIGIIAAVSISLIILIVIATIIGWLANLIFCFNRILR